MKKLFLLLIIPFFFISLYAVDPDPTADATVQLNLTTDHFVIGFAREEGNAKAYKSDTNTTFVLETHVNVEDKTLKTTAEGSFFIFYNAVIGTNTTYKLYLQINNPLLHTSHALEENPTYKDSEYIPYSITVGKGSAEDWKWDGSSKSDRSAGFSISSPALPKATASKVAIEDTNLRGDSTLFNVSGYAKVTASVTDDIKRKAKGSYESTITLIVSTT